VLIAALEALRHPKSKCLRHSNSSVVHPNSSARLQSQGRYTHVVHASSNGCANQVQVQEALEFEDNRGKFSTEEPRPKHKSH
jgi:hypothetical protein